MFQAFRRGYASLTLECSDARDNTAVGPELRGGEGDVDLATRDSAEAGLAVVEGLVEPADAPVNKREGARDGSGFLRSELDVGHAGVGADRSLAVDQLAVENQEKASLGARGWVGTIVVAAHKSTVGLSLEQAGVTPGVVIVVVAIIGPGAGRSGDTKQDHCLRSVGDTWDITGLAGVPRLPSSLTTGLAGVAGLTTSLARVTRLATSLARVTRLSPRLTGISGLPSSLARVARLTAGLTRVAGFTTGLAGVTRLSASLARVSGLTTSLARVARLTAGLARVSGLTSLARVAGFATRLARVARLSASLARVTRLATSLARVTRLSASLARVARLATSLARVTRLTAGLAGVAGFTTRLAGVAGLASSLAGVTGLATGLARVAGFATGLARIAGLATCLARATSDWALSTRNLTSCCRARTA